VTRLPADPPCQGSEGVSTPYGRSDTWPDVEAGSSPRKPVEQPLPPAPYYDPSPVGWGWGG
jgi:hypothetical protein